MNEKVAAEPLNLDDLDLPPDDDDDEIEYVDPLDENFKEESPHAAEIEAERVTAEKGLPSKGNVYNVQIVTPDKPLMHPRHRALKKPVRFPFATMKIGDAFEVPSDPNDEMRKQLKYDRARFYTSQGKNRWSFRIKVDENGTYFLTRTA